MSLRWESGPRRGPVVVALLGCALSVVPYWLDRGGAGVALTAVGVASSGMAARQHRGAATVAAAAAAVHLALAERVPFVAPLMMTCLLCAFLGEVSSLEKQAWRVRGAGPGEARQVVRSVLASLIGAVAVLLTSEVTVESGMVSAALVLAGEAAVAALIIWVSRLPRTGGHAQRLGSRGLG